MSEETPNGEQPGGNSGWTPPASQDELNRIISERVTRERAKYADYAELKTKAAEFDRLAESQKTETQKALERAEAAETALAAKQSEALRLSVIAKHQIPEEYQDFVSGDSEDDLTARAERVKALIASSSTPQSPFPKADPSQGGTGNQGKQTTADLFASAVEAQLT